MNIEPILSGFGINSGNIYRKKYYYVVTTASGCYCLSAAREPKQRLEEIDRCKALLCDNGFYQLDSYVKALNKKPYYEYNGEVYTLCKYFGDSELDIMSNIQCKLAFETIGRLAYTIKNCSNDMIFAAQKGDESSNPLIHKYEKNLSQLIKNKKKLSSNIEFDRTLKKYVSLAISRSQRVLENIKKLNYGKNITICHNSLKENNLIYHKGKCRIIDWDNMTYSSYIEDISFFIQRYIRKNAYYKSMVSSPFMNFNEIMSHYCKYSGISQNEWDIILELISYPMRFNRLVDEYCSKRRCFVPSGLKRKIDECINEWDFDFVNI